MTRKPLNERLQNDKENILDRRRVNSETKEEIAELLQHGDVNTAAKIVFHVMTGEEMQNFTPSRDIDIPCEATSSVLTELGSKNIELEVKIGNNNKQTVLSDSRKSATVRSNDIPDGTHTISASIKRIYGYASDDVNTEEYEVISSNVSLSQTDVTVDTTIDTFGVNLEVGTITIDELTVGNKL